MRDELIYGDDDTHPIPCLDVCDVIADFKGNGGNLVVVIASPIKNDPRSRERLLTKIENYLRFISSSEFSKKCGKPTKENTVVTVRIHTDSDQGMFDLLERCRGWIEDNHARLEVIRHLPNSSQAPRPARP